MKPLDPYALTLSQTTLIEASAGTGKTYTITTLVARLVAVGYPVESILVVTFTEAAAAELKLRIRSRLAQCLTYLESVAADTGRTPEPADDLIRFLSGQPDPGLIRRRISLCLACFDQACIMTIHSFCLATLTEHAFETGTPFDMTLTPDRTAFFHQVCMDFFMTRVNDLDPVMLKMVAAKGMTPEGMAGAFGPVAARTDLSVLPENPQFEDVSEQVRDTMGQIRDLLETETHAVTELIRNHKGLDKRSYSKKNVPAWLSAARDKCRSDGNTGLFVMTEKGDSLYKFTRTRLTAKTKAGAVPPDHALFDRCEQLLGLYRTMEINVIALKRAFLDFFDDQLARFKQTQGRCFFDDLVNDLAAALSASGKDRLITAVRERYQACLIDEFQDTDPAQYAIFSALFNGAPSAFGGQAPFFMIGDPKQAIYAFRGGDIFAYLAACKDSDEMFTLEKNFRSSPRLVQAVNDVFCLDANPFLFDAITFTRVGTPDAAQNRLTGPVGPVTPLVFDFISRDDLPLDRQGFIKKDGADKQVPDILARQILADLTAGFELGEDGPVTPGHMAVLVRTNRQAEAVRDALTRLDIPSYLSKTGSVYDSSEAVDMHDILTAVFQPDRLPFVKAALATPVLGLSLDELAVMDEAGTAAWQDRFRTMKTVWETRGFTAMIMALLFESDTAGPDIGERALTNYFHLIELISQAASTRQLSMFYLLQWFRAQLFADTRDEAGDELRLESDKKAVAIVTIHKSKGLEYPLVYLPYLWSGARAGGPVLFHDPEKDNRLCLDLRPDDAPGRDRSVALRDLETAAEERRLLYVALTRASAQCRILWGGISGVDTSALGQILHPRGCSGDDVMVSDLEILSTAAPERIQVNVPADPGRSGSWRPASEKAPRLQPRTRNREIGRGFGISSFTALTASASTHGKLTDAAPDTGRPIRLADFPKGALLAESEQPIRLADFPKGAGSGEFFHMVMETLDFRADDGTVTQCVRQQLRSFGFSDPALEAPACSAVRDILDTPLGDAGFCLRDIGPGDRLTEMEFLFDANRFSVRDLADLFRQTDHPYAPWLRQLDSETVNGFIKGFIDLIVRHKGKYYILDYKTNFLGSTYDHYDEGSMAASMAEHHYILQYHLYVLALVRYLALRLPDYDHDRDFGGVFYLYIRGMHPDLPGSGIYFDRPSRDFVSAMDRLM